MELILMKKTYFVLVAVILFVVGCGSDNTLKPTIDQIIGANEPVVLAPGTYKEFRFTINVDEYDNSAIRGEFSVVAGEKVRVMVMTETSFNTWRTTGTASFLYESGTISNDELDINLDESGNYYLVFSNQFDTTKDKSIFSSVALLFDIGDIS